MILRARSRDSLLVFDDKGTVLAEVPIGLDAYNEGERGLTREQAQENARAIARLFGVLEDE